MIEIIRAFREISTDRRRHSAYGTQCVTRIGKVSTLEHDCTSIMLSHEDIQNTLNFIKIG